MTRRPHGIQIHVLIDLEKNRDITSPQDMTFGSLGESRVDDGWETTWRLLIYYSFSWTQPYYSLVWPSYRSTKLTSPLFVFTSKFFLWSTLLGYLISISFVNSIHSLSMFFVSKLIPAKTFSNVDYLDLRSFLISYGSVSYDMILHDYSLFLRKILYPFRSESILVVHFFRRRFKEKLDWSITSSLY